MEAIQPASVAPPPPSAVPITGVTVADLALDTVGEQTGATIDLNANDAVPLDPRAARGGQRQPRWNVIVNVDVELDGVISTPRSRKRLDHRESQ